MTEDTMTPDPMEALREALEPFRRVMITDPDKIVPRHWQLASRQYPLTWAHLRNLVGAFDTLAAQSHPTTTTGAGELTERKRLTYQQRKIAALQEAIARYGDRLRMGTAPERLQFEIDEAIKLFPNVGVTHDHTVYRAGELPARFKTPAASSEVERVEKLLKVLEPFAKVPIRQDDTGEWYIVCPDEDAFSNAEEAYDEARAAIAAMGGQDA